MDWKKYYEDTQEFINKCRYIASAFFNNKIITDNPEDIDFWSIDESEVYAYGVEEDNGITELKFKFYAKLLSFSDEELKKYIEDMVKKQILKRELLQLSKEELVERVMHPFGRV